jgi:hypothetical protein
MGLVGYKTCTRCSPAQPTSHDLGMHPIRKIDVWVCRRCGLYGAKKGDEEMSWYESGPNTRIGEK